MLEKKIKSKLLIVSLFVLIAVISLNFVYAVSCWTYNTTEDGCTAANGCIYKNDSWGSWCEELSCWSLNNQSACTTAIIPGQNCSWDSGSAHYNCEPISCWSFSGTNNNSCINNAANKSCNWEDKCYNVGGFAGVSCWDLSQNACKNTTGCSWGQCEDKGCDGFSTADSCNSGLDWQGANCTWNSGGSYCRERWCGDTTLYPNQTACNAAVGIDCEWKNDNCREKRCSSFDNSNETACVNNTIGESCKWDGISDCREDDCWNYNSNASCQLKTNCQWIGHSTAGWCEDVNCWDWDSSHDGGSEGSCNGNSSIYGLNCVWENDTTGTGTGWCYRDSSEITCANLTTERECYDTYYCWWESHDWDNPSAGGNCTEPNWGGAGFTDVTGSILNDWNPGCYIFDHNSTKCNNIIGCNFTINNECEEVTSGDDSITGNNITNNGVECAYINESTLCNNIPALATCCTWNASRCINDRSSRSCVNQLAQTPKGEVACEDADSSGACATIAGDPWYMPCAWNNVSKKCDFDAAEVFGNTSKSIVKIENKRNCEAAGGKWITENYCEGTVSVPVGRCEYKFDDEDNCDKACFACENKNSNGDLINSTNAKSACLGSKLGFCEFSSDTNSPNGIGYCKAKKEWKRGIAGDCDSTCGDCAYLGDPNSNSSEDSAGNCLSPECFCDESGANAAGGGCKWIGDNTTRTGGYCLEKGEKTCVDACDRCNSRDKCVNTGRSALNSTGSCKWQGSDDDGDCVTNVAGNVEICWDGVDNNNDGLVDCADSSCYSDTWCGFVEGDCFGWPDNNSCIGNGCEWVNDSWNPKGWCDFKGSQCWRNDYSESACTGILNASQQLNINATRNGTTGNSINESFTYSLTLVGSGWVVGSFVITNETGGNLVGNFTVDYISNTINFSNTTAMAITIGKENLTNISYQYYADPVKYNCEWNNGSGGGWCEQDWSIGEECFGSNTEAACNDIITTDAKNCTWTNDTWCASGGGGVGSEWCNNYGGWCDHADFADSQCWEESTNETCNAKSGCNWFSDPWGAPHCEVNWSGGGSSLEACWDITSDSTCTGTTGCAWRSYGSGNGGTCEPSCWGQYIQSDCEGVSGCLWQEESGWCEEQQAQVCYNSSNSNTQANCDATSGCKWNNPGWCDPKDGGFSGGSGQGAECYRYDGNQTQCTNKTIINISCGWYPETNPFCEVDWSTECWQYTIEADCVGGGCWWNNQFGGSGFCANQMDQCWSNFTLQTDAAECNRVSLCNSTAWGGCEPTCFNRNTESACGGVSGCKWVSGWCNPVGMNDIFDNMEPGAPVPIGFDTCDGSTDTNQDSVDICGFGMKDTGEGYGFGINVFDFTNSSTCNKEKISSYVQEGFGVGGSGFSDRTGNGNDTVIFFVYLDTDGNQKDGCTLTHDSTANGYEFRFRYSSEWNGTQGNAIETFNAYKCENARWAASDIKLKAWKKLMCSEIGGAMIAVEKSDLNRFPTLYDSTADMRVYVATIGNPGTGNVSSPTDTAGPGFVTPGTVDFEIFGCFDYGADSAKFEDILSKGYVQGEDCYSSADDDGDGDTNCNDWDCQFASVCAGQGVNATGYNDTRTPQVIGVRIEEYPDSALIMYDTNKAANGSLLLYGNDSRCLNLNSTINDIGIRNDNVRAYKQWHKAEIFNDSEGNSLNYALINDTTYYYKLKVCDGNNKCALSKCTSFVTSKVGKCGFCNFVTRIKTPSDWDVQYDYDQDGSYEHVQGKVCGPNSGMKSNYTMGRKVNIKLNSTDGGVYFEFINASLTKTGLNDKVRSISNSGDLIQTSTIVGLTSETRDKIINNLHPEECRIKVPFSGTCDELFHCDDSGDNCVDRTTAAGGAPIDATNCVWKVPNCEFSTYREAEASSESTSGTTGGGSGGGGGGGGSTTTTSEESSPTTEQPSEGGSAGEEEIPDEGEEEEEDSGLSPETSAKKGLGTFFWVIIGIVVVVGVVAVWFGVKSGVKKRRGY